MSMFGSTLIFLEGVNCRYHSEADVSNISGKMDDLSLVSWVITPL